MNISQNWTDEFSYDYVLPSETIRHTSHGYIMPKWANWGHYHEIEAHDLALHCSARSSSILKKSKLEEPIEIGYEYHLKDYRIAYVFRAINLE